MYIPTSGELRQVTSIEKRVNEARRMGFSRIIIPKRNDSSKSKKRYQRTARNENINVTGIDCIEAENLTNAIELGLVSKLPKRKSKKKKVGSNDELPLFDDDDLDYSFL